MIDVHDAHHAASTWREFFIHIATIVLGLLIAVGLEQTVEYFHHWNEVTQTREALQAERRANHMSFFSQTEEFHRFVPILQTNLAIFQYLKKHPGAPPGQWPGQLDWYNSDQYYPDSAWKTAQQNNMLELMPEAVVHDYAKLYTFLAPLSDHIAMEQQAVRDAAAYTIQDPDPAHLSPAQLDRQIDLTTRALAQFAIAAWDQRNLASHFPDFPPTTTRADESSILHTSAPPGYIKDHAEILERAHRYDEAHPYPPPPSQPAEATPAPAPR
jgi:hypothetical protein